MKKLYTCTLVLTTMLFVWSPSVKAQTTTGGVIANFGIDADAYSSDLQFLVPKPSTTNTDDWFSKPGGGIAVIDTTGSAAIKAKLLTNGDYAFTAGMNYPRFSVQGNYLFLNSRYARDYASFAAGAGDSTVFFGNSNKNGQNPSSWSTAQTGAGVLDKDDIIDMYVHMRRDLTTKPSHLILFMGATTLSSGGNHYIDFELYRSRIDYNTTTGLFENSGPANTGGHSAWTFNADGSLAGLGDLTASFSFSSATVTNIGIWIWVSKSDYQNVVPQNFDFVPGQFNGDGNNASWGYAQLQKKGGGALDVWGIVNTAGNTVAAPWGTASKDLGSNSNDYYSANYAPGQFAEVGIDLTTLGIDPLLNPAGNPCDPPFTRIFVKSRTSSAFTAELKDFIGPYSFLDAPQTSATIATPQHLTCNVTSVTLEPAFIETGSYTWTTSNGNIVSQPDSTGIVVNQPGTYYLSAAPFLGCTANIDSVQVYKDTFKPVASANVSGTLLSSTPAVTLLGGNPVASNYITPYGGSQGLLYNWTGPFGYFSPSQNSQTSDTGKYRLIVTENRNGCMDTAYTNVFRGSILPVSITSFTAEKQNDYAALNWTTSSELNVKAFNVERSIDNGKTWQLIGEVIATGNSSVNQKYSFIDQNPENGTNLYRLQTEDVNGSFTYSSLAQVKIQNESSMNVYPNPVGQEEALNIQLMGLKSGSYKITMASSSGQIVKSMTFNISSSGSALLVIPTGKMSRGNYVVIVTGNGQQYTKTVVVENR